MKRKKIGIAVLLMVLSLTLSGCAWFSDVTLDIRSNITGLPFTISTYDYDGQKIDQIKASSVKISTYKPMSKVDSNRNEQSNVIDVEYGNHQMIHVGSSLIANEGLTNYQDKFNQKVNIKNLNPSVPMLSEIYNNFKNNWVGKSRVIMIRSQAGKPIAIFVGNRVRVTGTDMKSTTKINVDGRRLFIYRCDYSIYDLSTVEKM